MKKIIEHLKSDWYKYLLEIIVIMMGILGAFALNNWNEERKMREQGKQYVREIYSDLKNDVQTLEGIIDQLKQEHEASGNVLEVYESPEHSIEDSLAYWKNLIAVGNTIIADRTPHAWDELKFSGGLGILQDDALSTQLYEFYSNYDLRIANFKELPQLARVDIRRTKTKLVYLIDLKRYQQSNFQKAPGKDLFIRMLNNQEMPGLIREVYISCIYNIPWFEELLLQSRGIVTYMEENVSEIIKQEN